MSLANINVLCSNLEEEQELELEELLEDDDDELLGK